MKLTIKHIKIKNFKCFEDLDTDMWQSTIIEGDNESGKSTIATAILWCLTGKDIDNNATFEIVPQGKYGSVSPRIELECMIDDRPLTLAREYKLKLARDKTVKGYDTTCYINGLEVGVRKFQDYISQNICNESIFKILSNPYTFVENCPKEQKETMWQAQRRLLMQLVETEEDSAVAEKKEEYKSLVEPLKRYENATQYLAYLKQKSTDLQKQINSYESRILQQQENIVEVEMTEEECTKAQKEIESELLKADEQYKEKVGEQRIKRVEEFKEKRSNLLNEKQTLETQYAYQLDEYESERKRLETMAELSKENSDKNISLQGKYATAVEQLMGVKICTKCETCGQPLTEEMIEKKKQAVVMRIKDGKKYVEKARADAQKYLNQQSAYLKQIDEMVEPVKPLRICEIESELAELYDMADDLDISEFEAEYKAKKQQLQGELYSLINVKAQIEGNKKSEERLSQLYDDMKEDNAKSNELQMQKDLCQDFIVYKCKKAEENINNLFKTVKFQLFEHNKSNDDIREVCNMTFNGHQYNDLSASTKLIANLELLNAFQKYYNIYIPIVCDNMESVTADVRGEAQTILLYVKEELCFMCCGKTGRRKPNGLWECETCHAEWKKKLEIKENLC